MAWKSFYIAAGIMSTAALPFFEGLEGAANLPDGPCLVAANHSSFLDGPLLALAYCKARLRPLHMIAYEEPFRHWLMGWVLRCGGCIPFKRGDRRSQGEMMTTALGWLGADEAIGIFPEGHVNHRPELNRPRPGAALLALESGVPIIPTAILGTDKIMPRGKTFPRPAPRARVVFGQPLPLLDKERLYRNLPKDERDMLAGNLGYRIVRAIGLLSGRECRE